MRLFLKHARDRKCVVKSIKVALIVGTILALINQYASIFSWSFSPIVIFQILLTYLVPYAVSTYSHAMFGRNIDINKK